MKRLVLLLSGAALLALLALATPSQATIGGGCTGTLGGNDMVTTTAMDFEPGITYDYTFTAPFPVRAYSITVVSPLGEQEIASGTSESDDTTVSGSFDLAQLEGIAVGKYDVNIQVNGETASCAGSLEATILGNPLATVLGASSAVLVAGGSAGAVVAFIKALAVLPK